MPDFMDHVQDRVLAETERAIASRTRVLEGKEHCVECGDHILPLRTAMGAQLCLDCQQGLEARDMHRAAWARRC